uniref:Uncharacterized protein n=1 Tax=Ditylenchus dipsaci TaxID=166011 RepID=A0A915ELR3_9BILA
MLGPVCFDGNVIAASQELGLQEEVFDGVQAPPHHSVNLRLRINGDFEEHRIVEAYEIFRGHPVPLPQRHVTSFSGLHQLPNLHYLSDKFE